uniref:Protein TsetseEP domain-containing protein n=1 Tax=Anopheles culicifacies TaxID=139723 RepID=A0A182MTY3_9DIPT
MKAFCFALTILCAVQGILAFPRPDFGINGAVSGSAGVRAAVVELNTEITKVGAGTYTSTSGFTTLTAIGNALMTIGDSIVATSGALATSLDLLASDSNGPVATVFNTAIGKIDDLVSLLDSAFNGMIPIINTNTNQQYINRQFTDAFTATKTTLGRLKTALNTLKTNVESARTAAGSSPTVSAAIIRARIPARSVNNVIAEIRNLRANMPLITFVIDSSLENLRVIDSFIVDMKAEIEEGATRYTTSVDAFKLNVEAEGVAVNTKLGLGIGSSVSSIISSISSDLSTNEDFNNVLTPKLNALNEAITSTLSTKQGEITSHFGTYKDNVPNLITNLVDVFAESLCAPIKSVSLVQIANGGFSDFCFSKFSPRVFAQISLTLDAFDVCFEREVSRLISFEGLILELAIQISYNTADLLENLSACLSMPDDAQRGTCYAMLTPYYNILASKVDNYLTKISTLVAAETAASYNRVGACLHVSLSETALSAMQITSAADSCLTTGPVV